MCLLPGKASLITSFACFELSSSITGLEAIVTDTLQVLEQWIGWEAIFSKQHQLQSIRMKSWGFLPENDPDL